MNRRRKRILIAVGLISVIAGVGFISSGSNEPMYQGKRLSEWLQSTDQDALNALHEIGEPAFPFLVEWLHHERSFVDESRKSFYWYSEFNDNVLSSLIKTLPVSVYLPRPSIGAAAWGIFKLKEKALYLLEEIRNISHEFAWFLAYWLENKGWENMPEVMPDDDIADFHNVFEEYINTGALPWVEPSKASP